MSVYSVLKYRCPAHGLRKSSFVVLLLGLVFLVTGCKKTPEYVLDNEAMAQLMADIHIGEAVIDFNYSSFSNDSTRKLLKQSIYQAHGVTAEQVDTSFVWYGNNIEEYIKVYDRTIEILHQRQGEFLSATSAQIAIAGDSVAVWRGPERIMVTKNMPSRIVSFSVAPDSTWKSGDIYTLQYKPINGQNDVDVRLMVDYAGGLTRYIDKPNANRFPYRLQIQVDSTETPLRVYGYLAFNPENNIVYEIDSISLTRQRKELISGFYARTEEFRLTETPDSIEADSDDKDIEEISSDLKSARRPASTQRHRPLADEVDTPESSSNTVQSEHRRDASQHKPTAEQRREARERQRSVQTVKKATTAKPSKARKISR